jgi:proteasome inhibitor subunit 1 (PI31)
MSFSTSGLESNFHLYKDKLKRNHDAIVVFVHWYLIQNGFKCMKNDGKLSEILPEDWISDEQVYLVRYTKDSKGYEMKILIVDEHVMINLAVNFDKKKMD